MDKRKIILEILQYNTDLMEAENGTGLYIANLDEVADELVKKLNIDGVSKCSVCDSPPIEVERVLDNEIVDFCLKCRKEI